MKVHVDSSDDHKIIAAPYALVQPKGMMKSIMKGDNRPEAIAQRRLQEMVNNSVRIKQQPSISNQAMQLKANGVVQFAFPEPEGGKSKLLWNEQRKKIQFLPNGGAEKWEAIVAEATDIVTLTALVTAELEKREKARQEAEVAKKQKSEELYKKHMAEQQEAAKEKRMMAEAMAKKKAEEANAAKILAEAKALEQAEKLKEAQRLAAEKAEKERKENQRTDALKLGFGSVGEWENLLASGHNPVVALSHDGAEPKPGHANAIVGCYDVTWTLSDGSKTKWCVHIHFINKNKVVANAESAHFKKQKNHAAGNNSYELVLAETTKVIGWVVK